MVLLPKKLKTKQRLRPLSYAMWEIFWLRTGDSHLLLSFWRAFEENPAINLATKNLFILGQVRILNTQGLWKSFILKIVPQSNAPLQCAHPSP